MDYKERYKEALERASKLRVQNPFDTVGQMVEYIFPELKVSGDEKIRKELIQFIKNWKDPNNIGRPNDLPTLTRNVEQCDRYIAWLEKQGKQKPYGQRKECKDCQFNYAGECKGLCKMKRDEQKPADEDEPKFRPGDIVQYITDSTDRRKIEEIDTLCNMYHTDSSPIMFEVEDEWKVVVNAEDVEQESANNAEPKFRPGDWIIDNEYGEVLKVTKADANSYEITNQDEEVFNFLREDIECNYHLWTIADAKDGDVLVASDGSIFLFAGVDDCACKCYVALTIGNNVETKGGYWETSRAVYPATKEQRDTLIKAMANAGYTFDFEKKELKRIEQKPIDKVEPKFKVGDWLQYRYAEPFLVEEITEQGYCNGNSCLPFEWEDEIRLWSIADANDGDLIYVSTEEKGIQAIFHEYKNDTIFFHCYLCADFVQGGYMPIGSVELTYPLQKTHYNRFFEKMKEAGYEWDAKNKTLWQTR